MFRRFRILVLLLILIGIVVGSQLDRFYIARWNVPLVVAVYPINADSSAAADAYVSSLKKENFADIEQFFVDQARGYKLSVDRPVRIVLAPAIESIPPKPPQNEPSMLKIMAWSLHLRWWSWRTPPKAPGPTPRVRLFLLFYDPATHPSLDHSTGLEKGRVGVVNLFASPRAAGSNSVIVAHELLHTLGATDKYDASSNQPAYPDGFAEPEAEPRYPQRYAELMGGRVPLLPTNSKIPDSLDEVIVGPRTAEEIGWRKR